MTYTKRQLIEQAYDELALAGYVYDISPEELQSALRRLEAMMATWVASGLQVSYSFGEDIEASSGLPAVANEATYLKLATRIAASKGKNLPQSLMANCSNAYNALMSWCAKQDILQQQQPFGMPRGAGQKSWSGSNRPFFDTQDTGPMQIGSDGGLTFDPGA